MCLDYQVTSCMNCVSLGGVLLKGITEIAGESAAGKSQLCLQLCLTVQLPSTHGGLAGGTVLQHTLTCHQF